MYTLRALPGALFALIFTLPGATCAQDFPAHPLHLVNIYAAGSTSDLHARVVAQRLGEQLGQAVIVENTAGAGGVIAMRAVARSQPPLGYTLLFTTNALVGNLYAFKEPRYKLEDFALVGTAGLSPYAIMVNAKVPGRTIQEFIAHVKANPGKLNYGSSGPTSGTNILSERLKAAAGLDMEMIPFKGGEPATQALMAGQIQMYFSTVGAVRNRVKTGLIKTLAVTGEQRAEIFPDLPTFREAGYPSVTLGVWNGIFAPAATPAPVIQKLRDAMAKVNASPEMRKQLDRIEFEPWTGTLDQFMTYIRAEGAAIAEDFRRLKIPLQE